MPCANGFEGYFLAVLSLGVAVWGAGTGVATPFETGGARVGLEC